MPRKLIIRHIKVLKYKMKITYLNLANFLEKGL